jgi:hypothetical protein
VLDDHDGSGPQTLDNGGNGYLFPQDGVVPVYEVGSTKAIGDGSSLAKSTFVAGVRLLPEISTMDWYVY